MCRLNNPKISLNCVCILGDPNETFDSGSQNSLAASIGFYVDVYLSIYNR